MGKFARLPISTPNTYEPLSWLQALWLPCIVLGLPLAAPRARW